jgi:hypothetical protein
VAKTIKKSTGEEVTRSQIRYALAHRITPAKRSGRLSDLTDEDVDTIELFVTGSQHERLMTYYHVAELFKYTIPLVTKSKIRYALAKRGYTRRVAR